MPHISVVMAVRNGERHVGAAIESILGQSLKDLEFIIINDGSTDNTGEILQSYQHADARIKVISQENLGLTKSLNRGLDLAQGSYIARQDADDISAPDRLKRQCALLDRDSRLACVGCDFRVTDDEGRTLFTVCPSHYKDIRARLVRRNAFAHGSLVFRKSALSSVGGLYDERMRYAQDYELILRLLKTYEVAAVDHVLYDWRRSRTGISSRKALAQAYYAAWAKTLHNPAYQKTHTGNYFIFATELVRTLVYYKAGIPAFLRTLGVRR